MIEDKLGKLMAGNLFLPLEKKLRQESGKGVGKTIFLAGPTGCGKTEVSLLLAEALNGEIVSCDSMQIYKGMDIGTAKVTLAEQQRVPHHMIDVQPVSEPYNVVDYYYAAQQTIDRLRDEGKVPIVVGGAGFYLHSLLYGPPNGPPSVGKLRESLEKEMEKCGAEEMYRQLAEKDPDYAETITPHDRHKIIRALEIMELTKGRVSSLSWQSRTPVIEGDFRCWFLYRPRPVLYQRVEERCDQMLEEGLLEEVKRLDEEGLRGNRTAAQAIGYRQALDYLDSDQSEQAREKMVCDFKKASRHYVKRQFTWFRKEALFHWLDVDAHDMEVLVDMMVQDCKLF